MRLQETWFENLTLRPIEAEDEEFLYRVYAASREEELAPLPWEEAQKAAFLRMQFAAQHYHYHTYYAEAEFLLIKCDAVPIGRIYVHRSPGDIRLMEIALLPEARGMGVGSVLVRQLIAEAEAEGSKVSLHVEIFNRAIRLYERMGFEAVETNGVYIRMERHSRKADIM